MKWWQSRKHRRLIQRFFIKQITCRILLSIFYSLFKIIKYLQVKRFKSIPVWRWLKPILSWNIDGESSLCNISSTFLSMNSPVGDFFESIRQILPVRFEKFHLWSSHMMFSFERFWLKSSVVVFKNTILILIFPY